MILLMTSLWGRIRFLLGLHAQSGGVVWRQNDIITEI